MTGWHEDGRPREIVPDLIWYVSIGFWATCIFGTALALIAALVWLTVPARAAEVGLASVYRGLPSEGGRRTASGRLIDPGALTAAHRSLPFGTLVRVTHGGRSVEVRINDRGPFIRGRVIDLTPAAAGRIGISGLGRVRIERVQR